MCTTDAKGAYKIETSLLPKDAAAQREQLARRLAAGDSSLDIMSIDPPFIPELAEPGFLAPVPADVAKRASKNVLDGAKAGATWNEKLVTVPFWANTQILWYRKSVAKAAGLDMTKPVTWDQLMKAAGDEKKFLGVQGAQAESMTVWINALIESAGGHILLNSGAKADEIKLGLTSPAGKMTMGVIAAVAEFERDLLIERTQSGLNRAKSQGKKLGRPARLSTSLTTSAGRSTRGWMLTRTLHLRWAASTWESAPTARTRSSPTKRSNASPHPRTKQPTL